MHQQPSASFPPLSQTEGSSTSTTQLYTPWLQSPLPGVVSPSSVTSPIVFRHHQNTPPCPVPVWPPPPSCSSAIDTFSAQPLFSPSPFVRPPLQNTFPPPKQALCMDDWISMPLHAPPVDRGVMNVFSLNSPVLNSVFSNHSGIVAPLQSPNLNPLSNTSSNLSSPLLNHASTAFPPPLPNNIPLISGASSLSFNSSDFIGSTYASNGTTPLFSSAWLLLSEFETGGQTLLAEPTINPLSCPLSPIPTPCLHQPHYLPQSAAPPVSAPTDVTSFPSSSSAPLTRNIPPPNHIPRKRKRPSSANQASPRKRRTPAKSHSPFDPIIQTPKKRTLTLDAECVLDTGTFKCDHCDKVFLRAYNLKSHLKTHTTEKPYSCMHCQKQFARKQDCLRHERIHTNDRPFKCERCDARFTRHDALSRHDLTCKIAASAAMGPNGEAAAHAYGARLKQRAGRRHSVFMANVAAAMGKTLAGCSNKAKPTPTSCSRDEHAIPPPVPPPHEPWSGGVLSPIVYQSIDARDAACSTNTVDPECLGGLINKAQFPPAADPEQSLTTCLSTSCLDCDASSAFLLQPTMLDQPQVYASNAFTNCCSEPGSVWLSPDFSTCCRSVFPSPANTHTQFHQFDLLLAAAVMDTPGNEMLQIPRPHTSGGSYPNSPPVLCSEGSVFLPPAETMRGYESFTSPLLTMPGTLAECSGGIDAIISPLLIHNPNSARGPAKVNLYSGPSYEYGQDGTTEIGI